jgi:hypothetical protein
LKDNAPLMPHLHAKLLEVGERMGRRGREGEEERRRSEGGKEGKVSTGGELPYSEIAYALSSLLFGIKEAETTRGRTWKLGLGSNVGSGLGSVLGSILGLGLGLGLG